MYRPYFPQQHGGTRGEDAVLRIRDKIMVSEILNLNDELRELIIEKRPLRQLKEVAYRNGTRGLLEAALRLVASGQTTVEELRRVTLSG
jgi:type II secretory ATPase GspE/PulE/Tfp pilus assembly ATPase PilB-like protein